jgi:hypothetical protein
MVPVARRNLFAEKGRFAFSVLGVAMAVMLVLVVLALYRGFSRTGETFELMPGELWLAQAGTTDPFHSLSLVQTSDLEAASTTSGVAAVVPVLSRQMAFEVNGSDADARVLALSVPDPLQLPEAFRERYLPSQGVMIIDGILSAKEGIHEGDMVDLEGVALTVGEIQPRSSEAFEPFVFINYRDAEAAFGTAGIVNFGMVVLEPGADATAVADALKSRFGGLEDSVARRSRRRFARRSTRASCQ